MKKYYHSSMQRDTYDWIYIVGDIVEFVCG